MKWLKIGFKALQDEDLEKSGGMYKMPFGLTRIGHRSDTTIFVRQRLHQLHGCVAHGGKKTSQLKHCIVRFCCCRL